MEEVKIFTLKVTSERDLTLQTYNQFQLYFQHGKTIKKYNKRQNWYIIKESWS